MPMVRTLGGLFDALRQSEEWRDLKPRTRRSYERVIGPQAGALAAVRARPLQEFSAPFVVSLRDTVAKRQKR